MFRYGDSGVMFILEGETQSTPCRNAFRVLSHDQMGNVHVCLKACESYAASRMTESAGVRRPVSMERSNGSRRQRILGLMGGGHGPSDGDHQSSRPQATRTATANADNLAFDPETAP